jgi:hypothetical protein
MLSFMLRYMLRRYLRDLFLIFLFPPHHLDHASRIVRLLLSPTFESFRRFRCSRSSDSIRSSSNYLLLESLSSLYRVESVSLRLEFNPSCSGESLTCPVPERYSNRQPIFDFNFKCYCFFNITIDRNASLLRPTPVSLRSFELSLRSLFPRLLSVAMF